MSLSGVARSAYRVACPGLMRHEAASVRPSILNLSAAVLRLTVIYDSYTGSSHLPGVRVQAPKSNRNPQSGRGRTLHASSLSRDPAVPHHLPHWAGLARRTIDGGPDPAAHLKHTATTRSTQMLQVLRPRHLSPPFRFACTGWVRLACCRSTSNGAWHVGPCTPSSQHTPWCMHNL